MCVEPTTAMMIASAGSSLLQFQQAKAQQKAQTVCSQHLVTDTIRSAREGS